jgi:hypothetical protein
MKITYIDYKVATMREIECSQAIFSLDKDNVICLNENDTLESATRIPKKDIQFIND